MSLDEEERLFEAAKSCLESVLEEGQKMSNVDIQYMLATSQKCQSLVQKLSSFENDPKFSGMYKGLIDNIQSHVDILSAKIDQLNIEQDQEVPEQTPGTSTDQSTSSEGGSGDKQSIQRKAAIKDTIVGKGGLTFQDIAGLSEAKQALTEAIIMPLQFPQLFTGCIKPWKRILLYGPPGTGKSRIAQAISAEINSTFYCVSSSDLVSSWVGESEKLIKELFQHATNQTGRSVIFIDEIDSICRQRSSREEEHTRRMKTELLKQMEGADNSTNSDKIFLLCATNCPWELDSAFLRRFQKRIYIPLPDREARLSLIKIHTKENKLDLTETEWNVLADKTDGYSGSDIANMTLGALFGPIRDLQTAQYWSKTEDGKYYPCSADTPGAIHAKMASLPADQIKPRQTELSDFLKSLQTHKQTVTDTELQKFQDFTNNFGEQG
ncbi:vacuolar protein sorting-associated protein 4B-like [Ruditapes philippinarum]|uniref:vacuolar protein sorting-associated protein 4B-like n=1 Tax=Ruditapes philippinarum TaxID=129788 RepID=UPI00295BFDB7|nr:vacuolar protein sorting-associated protein 4B-like [Ruditapes philippinarum]